MQVLYKYRRADEKTLALLRGEIYFAPYGLLNDPTDINLAQGAKKQYEKRIEELEYQIEKSGAHLALAEDELQNQIIRLRREAGGARIEFLRRIAEEFGSYDEFSIEWYKEIFQGEDDKLLEKTEAIREHIHGQIAPKRTEVDHLKLLLSKLTEGWERSGLRQKMVAQSGEIGVFCATRRNDNYGMWVHYADGFRGVCIGFDSATLAVELQHASRDIVGPLEVKYQPVTIEMLLDPEFIDKPENLFTHKVPFWMGEEEIRFVKRNGYGVVKVPTKCVVKIIIGNRVSSKYRAKIRGCIVQRMNAANEIDVGLSVHTASTDARGTVYVEPHKRLNSHVADKTAAMKRPLKEATGIADEDIPF